MLEMAEQHFPLETGGMLIGYDTDDGSAVVTEIIGAGPRARHRLMAFRPDHEYQQKELDEIFHRSDGVETYLGDWHTHPNGFHALSAKDKRVLKRIANTETAQRPHPIMLVLANDREDRDWRHCCVQFRSLQRTWLFQDRCEMSELSIKIFDKT
jgi:integrative and conjugative element protein (TIGR02256 family)